MDNEIDQKIRELEKQKKELQRKEKNKRKSSKEGLFDRLFNKKKLEKPDTVAVAYLYENGNADFMEVPLREGFFEINGKTYHERRDCTFTIHKERLPFAVIREGDLLPEGTKQWEEREMRQKAAICQDHIMKGIRHAERVRLGEVGGTKINPKAAILIGIALIILVAIVMGYR